MLPGLIYNQSLDGRIKPPGNPPTVVLVTYFVTIIYSLIHHVTSNNGQLLT